MVFETLLWLTVHLVISYVGGLVFLAWASRVGTSTMAATVFGVLALFWLALALPLWKITSPFQAHPIIGGFGTTLPTRAQYALAISLVTVVGLLIILILWSILHMYYHLRTLRREARRAQAIASDSMETTRAILQQEGRRQSGNPWLSVWISDGFQMPFTYGAVRPIVFCPSWIFTLEDPRSTDILLLHEYMHVKHGHHALASVLSILCRFMPWLAPWFLGVQSSLETLADRNVLTLGITPAAYADVLKEALGGAPQCRTMFGIGHDASNIVGRISRFEQVQNKSFLLLFGVLISLFLAGVLAWATGSINTRSIHEAFRNSPPSYWNLTAAPSVLVEGVFGTKENLADGILINTNGPTPFIGALSLDSISQPKELMAVDPKGLNFSTHTVEFDWDAKRSSPGEAGWKPIIDYFSGSFIDGGESSNGFSSQSVSDIVIGKCYAFEINEGSGHASVPVFPGADWSIEGRAFNRNIWVLVPPGWTVRVHNIKLTAGGRIAITDNWPLVDQWLRRADILLHQRPLNTAMRSHIQESPQ